MNYGYDMVPPVDLAPAPLLPDDGDSVPCPVSNGRGIPATVICGVCEGAKIVEEPCSAAACLGGDYWNGFRWVKCYSCDGRGVRPRECENCGGAGEIEVEACRECPHGCSNPGVPGCPGKE